MSVQSGLDELNHGQRQRLAFIDFSLQYFGHVCRQDLIQRFATGLAASTRDFTTYRELAPQNMQLDHATKQYWRTATFSPLFTHDPSAILTSLSRGFGDGISAGVKPSHQCLEAVALINPDASIIASLMRAIHLRCPVEVEYVSLSSGKSQRMLIPHALVNNGHRWHVRAFDVNSQSFRDFVCTRFTHIDLVHRDITEAECSTADKNWQTTVDLVFMPHPDIAVPEAIALDYGMQEGLKTVTMKAALAGYLLRYWQVDCSENYRIRGQGCQLALKNLSVLSHIENAQLAPGVKG